MTSYEELLNLSNKIKLIENSTFFTKLLKILKKYKVNYTENSNGIFFDLTKCNEDILNLIKELVLKYTEETLSESKLSYVQYSEDECKNISKLGPRLSNKEKNIVKTLKN